MERNRRSSWENTGMPVLAPYALGLQHTVQDFNIAFTQENTF